MKTCCTNLLTCSLAICMLFSARTAQSQSLDEYFEKEYQDTRKFIGKSFWFDRPSDPLSLCPRIPKSSEKWDFCAKIPRGKLTVRESHRQELGMSWFFVSLPDGRTGYTSTTSKLFFLTEDPVITTKKAQERAEQARQECERRGQPKIGMTIEEATATCWGKPRRVVKTTTAAGVQEDYIYGQGHVLRFENDKLAAILETAGR